MAAKGNQQQGSNPGWFEKGISQETEKSEKSGIEHDVSTWEAIAIELVDDINEIHTRTRAVNQSFGKKIENWDNHSDDKTGSALPIISKYKEEYDDDRR